MGVEPLDDGEVVLDPLRIIWARNTGGGHVRAKIVATKVKIKEVPPMIVVVGNEIKNNGDEGANISYGVRERDCAVTIRVEEALGLGSRESWEDCTIP